MNLPPLALTAYRLAWAPALAMARLLAWLERRAGKSPLPPRWRLPERLGHAWPRPPDGHVLWLHAASLGESKGLWAFAKTLRELPGSLVLTVNTPEALAFLTDRIAREGDGERWTATLAPLDHPRIVRAFLSRFRVRALVLFEVELWPHFVLESRRLDIPVFWISARATDRARRRYGRFPRSLRRVAEQVSWTQAQTEEDAAALRRWGCREVEVGADLRGLHSLGQPRAEPAPPVPERREGIAFLSVHADELPALRAALAAPGGEPVFVFPRRMEEVARFEAALAPLGFRRLSTEPRARRRIVDGLGRVGDLLPGCRAAVVGGSFTPRGGHNLWEPLAAGVLAYMGPHRGNQKYLAEKLERAGLLRPLAAGSAVPASGEEEARAQAAACREFVRGEFVFLTNSAKIAQNRIRTRSGLRQIPRPAGDEGVDFMP